MPKSKNRKNHRQKSAARKIKVIEEKKKLEKSQREMIMKLIEQEKQKGLYDNLPQINPEGISTTPNTSIEGPIL